MKSKLMFILVAGSFFSICSQLLALTPVDFSVIGDFRAFTQNIKDSPKKNNLNLQFQELEIAFQGYLNPFAKADVFVSSGGDNFEIEEASATILRGLPANLNIKAGQYLVDFGKLNQGHPHAWSFLDRPLVHRMLFGAEGLRDVGIQVSTLLPTSFYSKLSLNVLSGKTLVPEGVDRGTERPMGTGRFNIFFPVGLYGNVDVGLSGLYGTYMKEVAETGGKNLRVTMSGVDFKYKYRPSDYTAVIFQIEWMMNHRDIRSSENNLATITNHGGFAFVDCRFLKRYNIGAMFDYAPGIFDYEESDNYHVGSAENNNTPLGRFDDKNSTVALTGFLGFSLMEETTLIRLIGRYTKFSIDDSSLLATPDMTDKPSEFLVAAQLLFSMGPHKPHDF